jgi:Big-like domain-containing protein
MKWTITLVASTPFLLGACGVAMTQGPPAGHESMMTPFACTESRTGPGLDIAAALATIYLVVGLNSIDDSYDPTNAHQVSSALIGTGIVGVFAVSAGIGIDRISKCSAARRALTLRQAEAAAALAARRRSADLIGVQKVLITGGRDTITVGTWTQLVAKAFDSTGAVILDRSFAWSSSNDTIASVSAAGLVRARRVGTAVITANAGNVIGTANVVVVSER